MATLTIISWRDIPAQVVAKRGRETAKVQLSPRFQEAVDRAAMRAGKGSSDAYLADWKRSEPRPCAEDIHSEVAAEAAQLEARYTDEALEKLIRAKGLAQGSSGLPHGSSELPHGSSGLAHGSAGPAPAPSSLEGSPDTANTTNTTGQ